MNRESAIHEVSEEAHVEFKNLMAATLTRFLEEHPEESKKSVAMTMGATSADLSHWLSPKTTFTLPGHLIPQFCRITGDNSLIWHLQEKFERVS